jgi:hypothetical protein
LHKLPVSLLLELNRVIVIEHLYVDALVHLAENEFNIYSLNYSNNNTLEIAIKIYYVRVSVRANLLEDWFSLEIDDIFRIGNVVQVHVDVQRHGRYHPKVVHCCSWLQFEFLYGSRATIKFFKMN